MKILTLLLIAYFISSSAFCQLKESTLSNINAQVSVAIGTAINDSSFYETTLFKDSAWLICVAIYIGDSGIIDNIQIINIGINDKIKERFLTSIKKRIMPRLCFSNYPGKVIVCKKMIYHSYSVGSIDYSQKINFSLPLQDIRQLEKLESNEKSIIMPIDALEYGHVSITMN